MNTKVELNGFWTRRALNRVTVWIIRYLARKTATLTPGGSLAQGVGYNIRIRIYRNYPLDEPEEDTMRRDTHYAAMHGDHQALHFLIWLGADIRLKDVSGLTPLDYAVMWKHYRCVRVIARTLERTECALL